VRRNSSLPMASFRFRLAMDTLAFGYKIPVITALKGLEELSSHLLEVGHARHTKDVAPMEQSGWIVTTIQRISEGDAFYIFVGRRCLHDRPVQATIRSRRQWGERQ